MAVTMVSYKLGTLPLIFSHWSKFEVGALLSRSQGNRLILFSLFSFGWWFLVEFSKNTKNSLKVRKNNLKLRFDLVWWVPYCVLLLVGGHCRELNWVEACSFSVVRTVGQDTECRVVFQK